MDFVDICYVARELEESNYPEMGKHFLNKGANNVD